MTNTRRFLRALRQLFSARKKTIRKGRVPVRPGCVLQCDLGVLLEHTGVYIGNGKIVSLNRHGQIKTENAASFFPPGTNPDSSEIYVACYGNTDEVLASADIVKNAKRKINDKTKYNVVFNNCHRFTAGCVTGDFESDVISFSQLEEVILTHIETLRPKKPFWVRFWRFVTRQKPETPQKPASLNWRAADIPFKKI